MVEINLTFVWGVDIDLVLVWEPIVLIFVCVVELD